MAKGAARDAKKDTQTISLELPTETFITLGRILDSEFSVSREDKTVKRAKGDATIHPIETDVSLIEDWIVDTVKVEAVKAEKAYKAEIEAMKTKVMDSLIADGWTPPSKDKTASTSKKSTK